MNCRELIDFLDDYVDGRLLMMERARFEMHLAICAECREYLRTYRGTIALAKGASTQDEAAARMPDELVRAIMDARKR